MRKVIITRTSFLIPATELNRIGCVEDCWQLPAGHTLIAVNDPVFQNPKTLLAPSNAGAAAIMEEAFLFAPFYQQVRSLADILSFKVSTRTVFYHLVTTSRRLLEWPRLEVVPDWQVVQQIQIACHFPRQDPSQLGFLDAVFDQWQSCMSRLRVLRNFIRITFEPDTYIARCAFHHSAGDATMALFMLLSSTSNETFLQSVRLTPPASKLRNQPLPDRCNRHTRDAGATRKSNNPANH